MKDPIVTADARVLTVVAQAANGDLTLPNGNVFLREVFDKLQDVAARNKKAFRLKSVNSVNEIRNAVEAFMAGTPKPILQIVGHGRPGELDLGRSWTNTIQDNYRFYMIDNNSRELALLSPGRGCVAEVRLVGCNVGAEDGYPLLFTLSHLLDCDVAGATVDVNVEMFNDANGLYEGEMTRCVRKTRSFSRVASAPRLATGTRIIATRSTSVRGISSRTSDVRKVAFEALNVVRNLSLAAAHTVIVDISSEESKSMWSLCKPLGPRSDGSSVVEYCFDASVTTADGKVGDCLVEILSNRTCRLVPLVEVAFDPALRWDVTALMTSGALHEVIARYDRAWRVAVMSPSTPSLAPPR